jgi:hypothetical protein
MIKMKHTISKTATRMVKGLKSPEVSAFPKVSIIQPEIIPVLL